MGTLPDLVGYDAGRTIAFGQQGQKQRTIADLGRLASQGDYTGAEKAAFAGGETEMGLHLKSMNEADHARLVEDTARFAMSADTPEKWAAASADFQRTHPNFQPPPFQGRQALIDQAVPVLQQLQMKQERELAQQKLAQGGQDNVGLTPIPGVDAQGNPQYALPSRTGKAVPLTFPEGFTISKEPVKVETPTETILLDPITRQPIGRIPKDVQGAAAQAAVGTAQGTAQAGLEPALIAQKNTIKQINDLIDNPGLGGITGGPWGIPVNQWKPTINMSDDERRALTQFKQLQGGAFLEARQLLKGGGQITDYEGAKAEAAMTRMDRALSKEDFVQALKDFRDAVETGVLKMRAAAAGPSSSPAGARPAAAPGPAGGGQPTRIQGDADYNRLPSGTQFIGPDGQLRVKP